MKLFFSLVLLLFISFSVYGQRKLILVSKNGHRTAIKHGKILGFTLKGEPFMFDGWKTLCKACDTIVQKNLWIVDSIKRNYVQLKQPLSSYRIDTLTKEQFKNQDFSE